ncbi:hypothetical protein [Psychrobacillus sp. FSL K6-1464]|uniref:hypothetical protein n=1 Tax=Psychrobacillus sp. FSL K6-1464 TaxID=2921545 RepID=UPI0030F97AE4
MLKVTKRTGVSFLLMLLVSLLFMGSASAADSSTVNIGVGEYIKTTRPIVVGAGGTIHLEVVNTTSATLKYSVKRKGASEAEQSLTSGSVVGNNRAAYSRTLNSWDPAGEYYLVIESAIGKASGFGRLSVN